MVSLPNRTADGTKTGEGRHAPLRAAGGRRLHPQPRTAAEVVGNMNNSRRRDDIHDRYPIGRSLLTLLIAGVGAVASARAADAPAGHDWPQWRGPHFDGTGDAVHLPEKFSKDENLLWSVKLPGPSNGTPIISGDRIFTTAIDTNRKMLALALDRATGKVVWQEEVGLGLIHPKGENDVVSPSPTTDGKTVVFMYGTGDIVAFDRDGKRLWARNLQRDIGEFNINWIYGSAPRSTMAASTCRSSTPIRLTRTPSTPTRKSSTEIRRPTCSRSTRQPARNCSARCGRRTRSKRPKSHTRRRSRTPALPARKRSYWSAATP